MPRPRTIAALLGGHVLETRLRRSVPGSFLLLFAAACGGGGGSGDSEPFIPDVALLFVSGHNGLLDNSPSASYLHLDAGPDIAVDLISAGYTVSTSYFVDDAFPVGGYGGYLALVDEMEFLRDNWVPLGTRVVVVAHSHGGVWAHGAIRAVADLSIFALVDLDCSSYGWGSVDHDLQNAYLGGDPRDAYVMDGTEYFDLEDVVFLNVVYEFEVRSGDSVILLGEDFDDAWNFRIDDSTTGLDPYFSDTDHEEVHDPTGTTIPIVEAWLRARLAS